MSHPRSDHNRASAARSRTTLLYVIVALLSLIGLTDALYLTVTHTTGGIVPCTIISGCSEVLNSSYATVWGIPLALIGAVAYFIVFSLATLAAFGYKFVDTFLSLIVFLMFLTTLWLLYLQAFVIHEFCQFCLLSALVTVSLGVLVAISQYTRHRQGD